MYSQYGRKMILEIIHDSSPYKWSTLSELGDDVDIEVETVFLCASYTVDITEKEPSVTRTFSLQYEMDNLAPEENILWEGTSLSDKILDGFDISLFDCPETRGKISGIKVMKITHYVPCTVHIVHE